MRRSRTWAVTAGAIGLLLGLSACADDGQVAEPAPVAPEEEPAAEEPAAEEPAAEEPAAEEPAADDTLEEAAEPAVSVASSELGEILVDGEGRTVYLFDPDEQGPSTCEDECAQSWPPLPAEADATAGEGADDALLGSAPRSDGSDQLTYDGWPLYHWVGDEEPGDVNGQGVNEVWWVLAPDGRPLRDTDDTDDADARDY